MGVWAGGPNPAGGVVDVAAIAEVMRPILYGFFTARIEVYDPNRYTAGGEAELVFDSGSAGALVQPLRAPRPIEMGGQQTGLLGVRFQVKVGEVESGQTLRGGLLVKVTEGGNAEGLDRYVFAIPETIDSSLAWGRIWEASVVSGGQ